MKLHILIDNEGKILVNKFEATPRTPPEIKETSEISEEQNKSGGYLG